jgi:filamentous hemagglutinin
MTLPPFGYVVYFPQVDNGLSELMVSGYQKFMENDLWGLANATEALKKVIGQYGEDMVLMGHSRGALTVQNAIESLINEGLDLNFNLEVSLFGAAANAQGIANDLARLGSWNTKVESMVHMDDFVGTLIGLNDPTYGTRPENSSLIAEWRKILGKYPTVHSCYGALSSDLCKQRYSASIAETYKPTTKE